MEDVKTWATQYPLASIQRKKKERKEEPLML